MKTVPSLAGKVAVVTGASRGVGAGIATLLGKLAASLHGSGFRAYPRFDTPLLHCIVLRRIPRLSGNLIATW
jgi:hypothetical protein